MKTETKTLNGQNVLCQTLKTTLNKMKEGLHQEIEEVFAYAEKHKLTTTGPLEFIYFDATDDMDKEFTLEIALPVKEGAVNDNGESKLKIKNFGSFKAFTYLHKGSFSNIHTLYGALFQEISRLGLKPTNQVKEVYENWVSVDSDENITEIQIGIQ